MTEINSVLTSALIEETPVFKKNIYLDPYDDFTMYQGREFVFLGGTPVRSLFEKIGQGPKCRSWDGITSTDGKECIKMNESTGRYEIVCGYAKGVDITGDDGKTMKLKCQQKYNVYLEHTDPDKQYVLSLSFTAQKALSDYIRTLHSMGLAEDKVITRITKVEPPKGSKAKFMYKFEFVSELALDMTAEEEKALADIKGKYKIEKKEETVNDTADLLKTLLEIDGIEIDDIRARRLAMTLSKDGIVIDPKDL